MIERRHKKVFRGAGNVLFLDLGANYVGVFSL